MRVPGGEPTNEYPFEIRQAFYYEAQDFVLSQRVHGPTFALGDFNARLHVRTPSDHDVMGEGVFGNASKTLDPVSNRELLLELCRSLDNTLANTYFAHGGGELVTYRNFGVPPMDFVSHEKFAQLDQVVAPMSWHD